MWETWIRSLGWEDTLEKEVATHFSILAWKIPWTEEPGNLQTMAPQRVWTQQSDFHFFDTLHNLSLNRHMCCSLHLTHYNSLSSLKFSGFAKNLVEPS